MKACKLLGGISRNKLTVCGAILAMATALFSQTAPRANRITGELSSGPMATVSGTLHPQTRRATDLGEVDPEMQMETLVLNTSLSNAQRKDLETLLQALQDPGSPQYHKWLTQEQYGARYGLTEADLDKAIRWLTEQRLTVKRVARSRNAIYFSGRAEQVGAAFHTQLHTYQLGGKKHYANTTELGLPVELAGVSLNVRGLDNFRPHSNLYKSAATPNYTYSSTQHYLTPGDWKTIYDLIPVYSSGYDGTGIHVGVVGQTYAPPGDIEKFTQNAGTGTPHLTYVCISTADCTDTAGISPGDWMESDVDIEWVSGMAPGATVDFIYAAGNDQGQDVFSALQHAIEDYKSSSGLVLPVISMSYSECETNLAQTQAVLFDQMGAQASAQGQTLVVSSGDSGAAGCDAHGSDSVTKATNGISAEAPADSPNFTAVGGTQFSADVSDPMSYWNPVPMTQLSAQSYIPETSWNETGTNGLNTSGGGQSTLRNGSKLEFPLPSWQSGLVSGATGRLIPDIGFTAAQHDGYIGCAGALDDSSYGQMCSSGWYSSGGSNGSLFYYFFGTSLAAPSFAGALAVMEQSLGPQGNINPKLYQLAKNPQSYATVFHDIMGSNVVPCQAGTSGCVNGVMGYAAKTGYDMVTGLGSIDGNALFLALGGLDLNGTSVTMSATPNLLRLGDQVTLTAQIISLPGTGNGLIGGTITFKIGNTVLGTSAVSSGSATLTNVMVSAANGFSNGTDAITARYNGDSTYAPSNGSTTLSVSETPFTSSTTVYVAPNPAPLGYMVTLNAWVGSTISGLPFSGRVTFMVGNTILGTAPVSGQTAMLGNVAASAANGLSSGTNTITATYSGDSNFSPSSGTDTLWLSATRSATTITANSGLSLPLLLEGSTTGFSATVTSTGPGTPSGTVTFSTGTAVLGVITLGAWDAPAVLSNVMLTPDKGLGSGADIVTITYSGDAFFLPSSTSFLVTVYNTMAPLLSPIGGTISAGGSTGAQFFLHGANFTSTSVALWNGAARPTSFISSKQLMITLSSTDVALEGTYLISVANSAPNAGMSVAQPIAVQLWPLVANISGASGALAGNGSGNYVLTLTGSDISSYQPVVLWNGKILPSSYITPWQISATITASDFAIRPATVMVTNGTGGTSPGFVLY